MDDLTGKVAVITGAARGIGKGIAERISANGASVVIADIDIEEAMLTAAVLTGPVIAVRHDVRDEKSTLELAAKILEEYGRVDILVNNAGVGPKPNPVQDTTEEEYDRVMNTNAKGVFLTTKAFVQEMISRRSGRIINISSVVGQRGFAMVLPYVASKFAVTGMTHSLAQELAPYDITVNTIHPGILVTDLHSEVVRKFAVLQGRTEGDVWNWFKERIPLGRFQTPADVGEMAVFLASDRAKNITGAAFNVDGGWEMH